MTPPSLPWTDRSPPVWVLDNTPLAGIRRHPPRRYRSKDLAGTLLPASSLSRRTAKHAVGKVRGQTGAPRGECLRPPKGYRPVVEKALSLALRRGSIPPLDESRGLLEPSR